MEQIQLDVFLKMKTSIIHKLKRDPEDAVVSTFAKLEAWKDSRKNIHNSTAREFQSFRYGQYFSDETCSTQVNFHRTDSTGHVPQNENIHNLQDSEDAVVNIFAKLEAWIDSRKKVYNIRALV